MQRIIHLLALSMLAAPSHGALQVLTTIAPITDLVSRVGGDRIEVMGLVPEGVNSHTFEPVPSDARLLSTADLIIANGLQLESPVLHLAGRVKRAETPILRLGGRAISPDQWQFDFSFPRQAGQPNPHLWTNVMLAMRYVELIRDSLSALDAEGRPYYQANAASLNARLESLDARIFRCIDTIPLSNRRLVTYHDSFAYFAVRYGMTVIGAVQPADFAEPAPRDVVRIIRQLRDLQVPAIFGSAVFPSPVLEQIARESGARYVDQLRDDDLPGQPGQAEHSYEGMMLANLRLITGALGLNRMSGGTMNLDQASPIIELRELTAGYHASAVLAHLNLRIEKGAFVGIVGPTGAGKTTLLKAMMGLIPAASGEVLLDGQPVGRHPAGLVGYLPQLGEIDPFFPITLEQVMLLGLSGRRRLLPWPGAAQRKMVEDLADQLDIREYLHHHVRDVSGGQRQRAFLGRALLCNPRLLVLDEPTAGVDMDTQHDILQLLADLNRKGVSIVMTTHDLNAIALFLPQVICFNQGVVAQGAPVQVFTDEVLQQTFGENLTVLEHAGRLLITARNPLKS